MEPVMTADVSRSHHTRTAVAGLFSDRDSAEKGWNLAVYNGCRHGDLTVALSERTLRNLFHIGAKASLGKGLRGAAENPPTTAMLGAIAAALSAAGGALVHPGLGLAVAGRLASSFDRKGAPGIQDAFDVAGLPDHFAEAVHKHLEGGGLLLILQARNLDEASVVEREWKALAPKVIR
jgi:hypothetical protein